MFCSFCGKQIDDADAFCRHCGKTIKSVASKSVPPPPANRAKLLRVCLIVVALFLVVWALTESTQNEKKQPEPQPAAAIPTKPPPPPTKRTPKEEKQWESRNLDRSALEQTFLQAGLDVVVGNLVEQRSDDNRSLFIKGEAVNRPFVYNFLGCDAVRILKKDGFAKVTFMRHNMGDWIAEYDVNTGKIIWY